MKCKICNKPLNIDQQRSGYCSRECASAMPFDEKKPELDLKGEDDQKTRYPALHGLSKIYRFLAFLSGIVGLILIATGISGGTPLAVISGIATLIFGVIINLAISEGILLFIDIEFNTRKTSSMIKQMIEQDSSSNGG